MAEAHVDKVTQVLLQKVLSEDHAHEVVHSEGAADSLPAQHHEQGVEEEADDDIFGDGVDEEAEVRSGKDRVGALDLLELAQGVLAVVRNVQLIRIVGESQKVVQEPELHELKHSHRVDNLL